MSPENHMSTLLPWLRLLFTAGVFHDTSLGWWQIQINIYIYDEALLIVCALALSSSIQLFGTEQSESSKEKLWLKRRQKEACTW